MNATLPMPVIPHARSDDLHHLDRLGSSRLNLFMAGNQFMVMPELINAFQKAHPDIAPIYYQTLPPGMQLKQILANGALFHGEPITARADVYTSVSAQAMQQLADAGKIEAHGWHDYLHNRLVLLVPKGNPAGIEAVTDLARDDVRISQPDPQNEDIAVHIISMYRDAGGHALVDRIMEHKRAQGTTMLTTVHHRETPRRLEEGTVDVGPVWASEAVHAERQGLSVQAVDPGPALDQHQHIRYHVCRLKQAPHPAAARAFIDFLTGEQARAIYGRHGFALPAQPISPDARRDVPKGG